MDTINRSRLFATTALIVTLSICIKPAISNPLAELNNPFHVSWVDSKLIRNDLIFNVQEPLKNDFRIDTISGDYLVNQTSLCVGYSACILKNGKFSRSYHLDQTRSNLHSTVFDLANGKSAAQSVSKPESPCNSSIVNIRHHCSTNWNPPVYSSGSECYHFIYWHSPRSCPTNVTNYERPCYTYNPEGKLIDLTSWIQSDGTSYDVNTSGFNNSINFTVNVCNEAHESCGPGVSSCYSDGKNFVESGYINLTSIKYDQKDKNVQVTSLGHYNHLCPDSRVRTKLIFKCIDKPAVKTGPKLVSSDVCKHVIEWPTIHACPVVEVSAPAQSCSIKYEPLGIDLNIKKLVGTNESYVEVKNVKYGDKTANMVLGLCSGIPKSVLACEGKMNSATSACLIQGPMKMANATNSKIVGSIMKSSIRLSDDRLYLQSTTINDTCVLTTSQNFSVARPIGTRIEFFCSHVDNLRPTFLAYEDCTYIFEWGSRAMCLENFGGHLSSASMSGAKNLTNHRSDYKTTKNTKLSDKDLKIELDMMNKTAAELHDATKKDSESMIGQVNKNQTTQTASKSSVATPTSNIPSSSSPKPKLNPPMQNRGPSKVNNVQKFFMISLIVMLLGAFILVIFILDKKTRLRVPLSALRRRAGQAFQPQTVPYSRVDQFNDSLDL